VSRTVWRTLDSAASCRIEPYRALAFIARIASDPTRALRRKRSGRYLALGGVSRLALRFARYRFTRLIRLSG